MLSLIKTGLKINTIRAKMRGFSSQSILCKVYLKLVKTVKVTAKNTLTIKINDCGLYKIINNTVDGLTTFKVGGFCILSSAEWSKSLFNCELVIL